MIVNKFSSIELRIIGCLIEKEHTTPDQYPLTLNSLTTACNQKSSRDPVTHYTDGDVQQAIDDLVSQGFVMKVSSYGARVAKYQHRFCNTEFSELQLSQQELSIICLLFLRGPQTPGELRTRSQRMASFENVAEVEILLNKMQQKAPALVTPLEKEPGKRERRYMHLFCDSNSPDNISQESPLSAECSEANAYNANSDHESRIAQLEMEVSQLKVLVNELRAVIED